MAFYYFTMMCVSVDLFEFSWSLLSAFDFKIYIYIYKVFSYYFSCNLSFSVFLIFGTPIMYMLYTWWYLTDFWGFTHFYFFLPIPQTKVSIETSLFSISLILRSANSNLLLWFSQEYLISVILLFQLCIFYLIILSNFKLFIFILYLVFSKEESVIDSINHSHH